MSKNPFNIYQNANKEGMSQRELEASLLTRAGLMLKSCQDNWDAPERDQRLEEAVKFSQRIWSLFQSELSMPIIRYRKYPGRYSTKSVPR
jgi:flagellar protein FlaF